ncbi:unnamed protein product [Trifolium pratense]|uniref:Uncharacterized protein n=1 Tax=Trifolium pratense TaxID=57577 RepID=A0ACB0M1F2_TRIPR|nr:unnamed protein product [Trifolium pratense]
MASSSHFNNDVEDAAPPSSPRLSPALITDLQALPESDPRDGQATSWTSEDDDLVVLTEKQTGKRPQSEQGKSADTDLSAASVTNAELAALIAALKQTTEALQGQNRRMDEQNMRLDRLERNQRFSRNNSPPRRTPTSPSPPRQETVRQRRPALERIEQPGRKRDHVSPPREGISSPNVKKGKIVERTPPRRHSPQGLSLMTKQGQPVSRSHHTDQFSRSPTPDREGSPPLNSHESDEDDPRCPLSHDILQAPVPKGCERPPPLPAYDGLTDPDEHIASVNATLNFLRVSGAIRCRIFPTTLRKGAMAWYHSLAPRSITSWMDLSDQFRRHFTASRKQPKTEAVLDAIFQADNESLRSFIERFNKEAIQVETTDDMKKYLLQRGLRPNSDFAKAVGIEKPRTFGDLLLKSQPYIQYEEQQVADAARYGRAGNSQPAPRSNAEQSSRGGGRRRGERPREPRGPPSTFSNYTPLSKTQEEIWKECNSAEFTKAGIKFPRQQPTKPGQDKSRYCKYHKGYGHLTDDCIQLKDAIEILIRNGQMKQYVKRSNAPRAEAAETSNTEEAAPERSGHKPVALAISRPEDFFVPDYLDNTFVAPTLSKWDALAHAMVISGGGFDKQTVGSIKRKFEELIDGSSNLSATLDKPKGQSKPLAFYMEELPGGTANSQIPLLIRVDMANMDVRRYYTHKGQVATLHGDIEAARRVFNASSKGNEYIGQLPESKKSKATTSLPLPEISSIDLDSRFSKQENKDEKKLRKEKKEDDEASQEHRRPVPDGEFELMPFGEDPSRAVKIGTGLPELARKQLEACLKENADLFAWHASEMPGLDPNIACHQLTIDPTALPIVQRRRRQSPEKSEAAEKCVKDLLEANFISEARYTTWLSNVVLVKKSNGKWRMCCDYTDLNRACPKDSYPLPCIDRLVDNSSGFKLLSFMDAYSGYNQIPMAVADREKTAFMTESGNYYYNVMPFGLKNAGATYQRMMNKVFRGQIGDMLEVYMDDMIVKSPEELDHVVHLRKVFEQARKYNMRFNPEKCTFGVRAGKFLGFYLTERGIEANPDKCRAFAELPTPSDKKSIQTLNGMLTSLSRFVSKSAQHALPFFKLLKKEAVFEWTDECEQALQHLKKAVSAALIRETNEGQKPVYFTSKALQGPELRYQQIEKIALALVYAARRLRHYFLAHTIVVRTDQPVKSLLGRPDMAGRMLKWSLELSEFDIRYESRKALKAQVLADFVAEMTSSSPTVDGADKWTIFVDGASSATGAGAGIILENENGLLIEVSLALSFPTSNNQAEYEAFLAGLRLAEDLQAKEIKIYTDSQLVASQVLGEYQTKNDNLSEYLVLVKEKITKFNSVEILHVPREHNKRADILSKLASTKRKGGNKSVIQEILPRPSIEKPSRVVDINVIGDKDCWMTPVYNFLEHGTLPDDQKQAAIVRRRACSYVILDGKLYRRGFSIPLLKCVDEDTADYILREVHEGINAQHLGGRSLARKALRAGYYWPTMQQDAKDHVKKCDKCQRHGDMHLAPPRELKSLSSPWPFAWWGMDLLGPFTKGLYQNRYLIVAVDYFTKWVEAEPLSDITSLRVLRFFKRNVLARFGIPQVVVTDNGTQFTDKDFQAFLVALGTKQHFTSVEHPQTNGQAEAANKVILRGLRRRLDQNKKKWVEELDNVLWAYRTTPHSTTGETPFRMVYGTEAVIPVEIGEPSRRTEQPLDEEQNDEALREELDLVEEIRTGASLKEATLKQKIAARHDTKVIKREFEVGSLVLRRNADSQDGKLAPNWEGPYRVIDKTENGAYYLEDLRGKKLPRPWNAQKLKQYYS